MISDPTHRDNIQTSTNNRFFSVKELRVLKNASNWRYFSKYVPSSDLIQVDKRPTDKRPPTETHDHVEILVSLEGGVKYGLGGGLIHLMPGTAVFVHENLPHDYGYHPSVLKQQAFRHIWFRFHQHYVYAKSHCNKLPDSKKQNWGCLLQLAEVGIDFWRLWNDCAADSDPITRQLRLQSILTALLARLIQEGTHEQVEPLNSLDQAIKSVCNEVDAHTGRGISLEEIARKTGYNKHYFCRAFKARVGTTLHAFIDECRIRNVALWLGEQRSHKEIGALLGFSGAASFSRWHRKHRIFIDAALKTATNTKAGKRED